MDANGILNVSAKEKKGGKESTITITSDRSRSKAAIEEMVRNAEKFKAEDEKLAQRIQAKNELENFVAHARGIIGDEKYKEKLSEDDKNELKKVVQETQEWLDTNDKADTEELQAKLKLVQNHMTALLTKQAQAQSQAQPTPNPTKPETMDVD